MIFIKCLKFWSLFFVCFGVATLAKAFDGKLMFIPNKGQWGGNTLYEAPLVSGRMYALKNEVAFLFYDPGTAGHNHHRSPKTEHHGWKYHALKLKYLNANPDATIQQENYYSRPIYNYYKNANNATGLKASPKLKWQNLYTGINMVWEDNQGALKSTYEVQPGANYAQIKIAYQGADSIQITPNGQLKTYTSLRTLTESKPKAWVTLPNGTQRAIGCKYNLKNNILSFEVSYYDPKYVLTIDPELVFSTYSGSTAENWGNTATYGPNNEAYAAGTVFEHGYPVTVGAFQAGYSGVSLNYSNPDVGLLHYSPDGTQLLAATYLGGIRADFPSSCIADEQGNIIIMGITGSENFPVTNSAYQQIHGGGQTAIVLGSSLLQLGSDIFISKLTPTGDSLLASTYLGGSHNDGLIADGTIFDNNYGDNMRGEVILDNEGNICIASITNSTDFPKVNDPDTGFAGGLSDAVVAKLNTNLSALLYSATIGGTDADAAFGIKANASNNLIVTGPTRSSNFPVAGNGAQPTYLSQTDGFIIEIDPTNGFIMNGTFLGGTNNDIPFFTDIGPDGNIYVFGQTWSVIPQSPGTLGTPNLGQFFQRYSADLTTRELSTTIGSYTERPNISPTAFMVDSCSRVFFAGWGGVLNNTYPAEGNTNGLPVTTDAWQDTTDGSDFYLGVLESDFSELLYGTFLGGVRNDIFFGQEHVDGGTSRFNKNGTVFQAVCASCGTINNMFPAYPPSGVWSAVDSTAQRCNNVVFKFDLSPAVVNFATKKDTVCGTGDALQIYNLSHGGSLFRWTFGDGTSIITNDDTLNHTYNDTGWYNINLEMLQSTSSCIVSQKSIDSIYVAPVPMQGPDSTIKFCKGLTIKPNTRLYPQTQYQWEPHNYLTSDTIPRPLIRPVFNTNYTITATNQFGCTDKYRLKVEFDNVPNEKTKLIEFCPNDTIKLRSLFEGFTTPINWLANEIATTEDTVLTLLTNLVSNTTTIHGLQYFDTTKCQYTSVYNFKQKQINPIYSFEQQTKGDCSEYPPLTLLAKPDSIVNPQWIIDKDIYNDSLKVVWKPDYRTKVNVSFRGLLSQCHITFDSTIILNKQKIGNIVTPNNDGLNDAFEFKMPPPPGTKVQIYNRWGQRVFATDNFDKEIWKPTQTPTGTYYFFIKFDNGNTCKGWLNIKQ